MILEYLGGIETQYRTKIEGCRFMILEYLGGIETYVDQTLGDDSNPDFRIPRRD